MYVKEFLERNSNKPFVTNLLKYDKLDYYGKAKVISSFLTHLLIDAENGYKNEEIIIEVISILNNYLLYKIDTFLDFIADNT